MSETIGSHLMLSAIGDLLWSSKKNIPKRAREIVIPAAEKSKIIFLPSLSTISGVKPLASTITAPKRSIKLGLKTKKNLNLRFHNM